MVLRFCFCGYEGIYSQGSLFHRCRDNPFGFLFKRTHACARRHTHVLARTNAHRRMAKGGHGLPNVSPGPAMPYLSMPCGQATLKQPYGCFWGSPPTGWTLDRLQLFSNPLNTPHCSPMHHVYLSQMQPPERCTWKNVLARLN
jgi:hypothetical protein